MKLSNFLIKKGKVNKGEPPYDLREVFSKFTNSENLMSKNQLLQFIVEYQGEQNCTLLDLEPIYKKVLQNGSSRNESSCNIAGLSLDKFIDFLLIDDFKFNGPIKDEVHDDMNGPLSHYFMYTGHNSYLTGNQLTSESSDEPIIEALKQGVRVIELDLWASTKHGGIKVVHGRTLTTPVSLTTCLESIKKHAFLKSHFPVILTLEDHLTPKLQAKFAQVAIQIFGEMLYCPQTDFLTEFPSPASLKNMIVISTKPPKEYPQSDGVSNQVPNGSDSSEYETWELQDSLVKLKTEDKHVSDEDKKDINTSDHKSKQQNPREYRHLITIHGGKSEGCMKDSLKVDGGKVRRLSLCEKKLKTASESHGADLIKFTQKNILRIFPKGERVQSSNFRPHLGWMYGAQMVAFNMQGYGKSLWLMQGMFKANGGCGYVKKPEFLIQEGEDNEVFDPKITLPVKQILKVKVYKGVGWKSDFSRTHFDQFSPPDFYAKVYIVGVGADCAKKKTRVKMDNWYPIWDEEFEFKLTVPELALLRMEVNDKDQTKDDFAGQTCLPVSELRCGFRSVRLCDRKGKELKSVKLLLRFQLETL